MSRKVSWFSCGAASAVATKLSKPDVIAYCHVGSEDSDNQRFMKDCEQWFGQEITILKSDKYVDTWDVWEKKQYLSGNFGAPCTRALKIDPRLAFERHDDTHVFGYTCDASDIRRAKALAENWDIKIETPLIDRGITKAACLAMIKAAGIKPPRMYGYGFQNSNCVPCPKATSPAYYNLIRQTHNKEWLRMVELSRRLGVRLARLDGERVFMDEIPEDHPTTKPIEHACDFLCQISLEDLSK